MMKNNVSFRITTIPHTDGKITTELQKCIGVQTETMARWVMDSSEKGMRDALVQLGWTPPKETTVEQ